MRQNDKTLISLLDRAIALAQSGASRGQIGWQRETYETVARNLHEVRSGIERAQIPTAPGAGLGVTRFLSEAGLDDPELYRAVRAIEHHHRRFGVMGG